MPQRATERRATMVEYVGLDVSKEATAYCVRDEAGKVLARGKVASDADAVFEVLKEHCLCPERIVLETGTLSNWLARELGKRGLPVTIIDARRAHSVLRLQHNKTDENDAAVLAAPCVVGRDVFLARGVQIAARLMTTSAASTRCASFSRHRSSAPWRRRSTL